MKNFKELKIWQKGFAVAVLGFKIAKSLPGEQKFGLSIQITKAGVSIPSNIAEGNSRTSDKDKNRFMEIALGSCFEMETQLLIALAANIGDHILIKEALEILTEEEKMLSSFCDTLCPG